MKKAIYALIITCTLFSLMFISGPTHDSMLLAKETSTTAAASISTQTAKTEATLTDCLSVLKNSTGGWCEMRVGGDKPSISNIYPKRYGNLAGWGRPSSILSAWAGAAYDAENHIMYFTGGGHADYGGNEIYSFDLKAGVWRRLTEPSPLDHVAYDRGSKNNYIWIPDTRKVPGSSHSYDGLIFRPDTKTIFYASHRTANGKKVRSGQGDSSDLFIMGGAEAQQYEFNPSATETRNGIAPLSWRKTGAKALSYPRSAIISDGSLIIGTKTKIYHVEFNNAGKIANATKIFSHADYGDGNLLFDAKRNILWSIHRKSLKGYKLSGQTIYSTGTQGISSKSLALDASGNPVVWDGCRKVATYTPKSDTWDVIDWGLEGPTNCTKSTRRVYSKWAHIGNDVFVGISTEKHGVWVYKKGTPSPAAHPEPQVITEPKVEIYHNGFESNYWYEGWTKSPNSRAKPLPKGSSHIDKTSIVSKDCVTGKCLRVEVPALKCCGISIHYPIPNEQQNVIVEYMIKLAPNFTPKIFDKNGVHKGSGGKLPGLAHAVGWPLHQCGNGGARGDGMNCWSARLMFRNCNRASCEGQNKTRIGGYIYAPETRSNHGDLAAFDGDRKSGWLSHGNGTHGQLENNRWYKVRLQIAMNVPDRHDGVLKAWINGQLAYDKKDMLWRYEGHNNLHVRTFWMNVHFGGSLVGPKEDTFIMLDELKIYGN